MQITKNKSIDTIKSGKRESNIDKKLHLSYNTVYPKRKGRFRMKGATLADAAIMNTDELYGIIEALRAENQNLKTENQLLKALLS